MPVDVQSRGYGKPVPGLRRPARPVRGRPQRSVGRAITQAYQYNRPRRELGGKSYAQNIQNARRQQTPQGRQRLEQSRAAQQAIQAVGQHYAQFPSVDPAQVLHTLAFWGANIARPAPYGRLEDFSPVVPGKGGLGRSGLGQLAQSRGRFAPYMRTSIQPSSMPRAKLPSDSPSPQTPTMKF